MSSKVSEYTASDVQVGKRYEVRIKDCCVDGVFTAVLTSRTVDFGENEDVEYPKLEFDNGVVLTVWMQVDFYEVTEVEGAGD